MFHLTKFEKIRILGARATQISRGAQSTVNIQGLNTAIDIAKKELQEKKLPMIIQRIYPNGDIIEIPASEMES